ncbi:MAG: hypothetical protein ABSC41_04670 [Acidimicrobiales bacterium]
MDNRVHPDRLDSAVLVGYTQVNDLSKANLAKHRVAYLVVLQNVVDEGYGGYSASQVARITDQAGVTQVLGHEHLLWDHLVVEAETRRTCPDNSAYKRHFDSTSPSEWSVR